MSHALRPYQLAKCDLHAGRGHSKQLVNATLQDVGIGCKLAFRMWAQFKEAMVQQFDPVTKVEEARKQLQAWRQTSRVVGYV